MGLRCVHPSSVTRATSSLRRMAECEGPATVVFDPSLTAYDFGPTHPMSPLRVDLTMRLAAELGVTGERLRLVEAPFATMAQLVSVHGPDLVEAVTKAGTAPDRLDADCFAHGLGTDDNPVFEGMHEAAAHVVGATVEACRQVSAARACTRSSITGGLHHAMPDRASGFCIYNDVAVGIQALLDRASSASRTSTSTSTTATASSRSSGTTRAC